MDKDTTDSETESLLNLKEYLSGAYLHPIFHSFENDQTEAVAEKEVELHEEKVNKSDYTHAENETYNDSPVADDLSSSSSPHYTYHYQS